MPFVTTADGAQIHYKDWGAGRPVVLSHGWPLNADSWEAQQLFLAGSSHVVMMSRPDVVVRQILAADRATRR